jgi:hypothetical protein
VQLTGYTILPQILSLCNQSVAEKRIVAMIGGEEREVAQHAKQSWERWRGPATFRFDVRTDAAEEGLMRE